VRAALAHGTGDVCDRSCRSVDAVSRFAEGRVPDLAAAGAVSGDRALPERPTAVLRGARGPRQREPPSVESDRVGMRRSFERPARPALPTLRVLHVGLFSLARLVLAARLFSLARLALAAGLCAVGGLA
jgi:hypothetical protein